MAADPEGEWKTFRADLAAKQELVIFGVMLPDSWEIHLLHSIAQYGSGPSAKYVGFLGDRMGGHEPTPVGLKKEKAFKWAECEGVVVSNTDIVAHFQGGAHRPETNASKFYVRGQDAEEETELGTITVPRLIRLDALSVEFVKARPCHPARYLEYLNGEVAAGRLSKESAKTSTEWSIVAAQDDGSGSSKLALEMEFVNAQVAAFRQFQEERLQGTLGRRQTADLASRAQASARGARGGTATAAAAATAVAPGQGGAAQGEAAQAPAAMAAGAPAQHRQEGAPAPAT